MLRLRNLKVGFPIEGNLIPAIQNIDLDCRESETLAIVGESGSGKSVLALTVIGLIQQGGGHILDGTVELEGTNLLSLSASEMRRRRGSQVAMIFQEPMTSLNPVFTVGDQIAEVFQIHKHETRRQAWKSAIEMLELVRIPAADERSHSYPHELSGGMRQRVMIAMALACRPKLLIADEPTTALDVTIQLDILRLIRDLQQELGMAILFITHDLGVVRAVSHRVAVMYGGQVVEFSQTAELFSNPSHPYTRGLLQAIPRTGLEGKIPSIAGQVPPLGSFPSGCGFRDRCSLAEVVCHNPPDLLEKTQKHFVRCVRMGEI